MNQKPQLRGINRLVFCIWYLPHLAICGLFLVLAILAGLWAGLVNEHQGERLVDWMTKKMDGWADQMGRAAERLAR
jgi:hypothetical protein